RRQVKMQKGLGDQVMIDQQVIDAPEQQPSECRIVEMSVDVVNRGGSDDRFNLLGQVGLVGVPGAHIAGKLAREGKRAPTQSLQGAAGIAPIVDALTANNQ